MKRDITWVKDVKAFSNPAQTDRSQMVLSPGLETDPFIFLAEDWFSDKGFDWHPHRGFETVTYVVDGELEHRDNAGGHGVLGAGDLQWTTTGRGVLHTEIAHQKKGVHTLQLWLNLPAAKKMSTPRYQDLRAAEAPTFTSDGVKAIVFAGSQHGVEGAAKLHHPTGVVDLHIQAGSNYTLQIPDDHFAFVYCVSGDVQIQDTNLQAGQVLASHPGGTELTIDATNSSHLIAYHGLPIREPIVQHGPFVMNTKEEIAQTIRDYQNGAFGEIPRQS